MTDAEKIRKCAETMGWSFVDSQTFADGGEWQAAHYETPKGILFASTYDPLHNKAQAMELVERFQLNCNYDGTDGGWLVIPHQIDRAVAEGQSFDLCRAIVECVSKLP